MRRYRSSRAASRCFFGPSRAAGCSSPGDGGRQPLDERLRLVGGVRAFGHDPSTMPLAAVRSIEIPCWAANSGRGRRAEHDRTGALGRQRCQPAVLRRDDPIGGQQRQRAAACALAEQQAQGRRVERHEVGQASGDLAGQPALLGVLGQRGAGRVDDGEDGQPQFVGQPNSATSGAQAAGPSRPVDEGRSWPSTTQGELPNLASASSVGRVRPAASRSAA